MNVTVTLKNKEKKTFEKVGEIQSISLSDGKELALVGYDHRVYYREHSKNIMKLTTNFEGE